MFFTNFWRTSFVLLIILGFCYSTDISNCTTIDSSGTYVATQNLSGANAISFGSVAAACMVINVSDVSFNCNNFNISNDGTSSAVGVLLLNISQLSNVSVMNCNIYNYSYGIYAYQLADSSIKNNFVYASSGYGLYVDSSLGNNISSNNISNSASASINTLSSSYNTFSNNLITESSNYGIYFSGSQFNNITNNQVIGTQSNGMFLQSSANNNNIVSNSLINIVGYGIYLQFSNSNNMTSNVVRNSSGNNYYVYGSTLNNIISNAGIDAYGVGSNGILLYSSSNSNFVNSNNFTGSKSSGISVSSSRLNNISSNTISNSSGYGIQMVTGFGAAPVNNTFDGNQISNTSNNGIHLSSGSQNNVTSNIISNSDDKGIYLTSTNFALIRSNTISNTTDDAISLLNSGNASIIGNSLLGDSNNGISLSSSSDAIVSSNTIENFEEYGIYVLTSSASNISLNTLSSSNEYSIFLDNANGSRLSGNAHYILGQYGDGIYDSDGVILNNEIYYGGTGIKVSSDLSTNISLTALGSIFGSYPDLANFTNLSLTDVILPNSGYNIGWSSGSNDNYTSFESKFIAITNESENVSLDSLVFSWENSELSGYEEASLVVLSNSSGVWENMNAILSTIDNTLSISDVTTFGLYGVFQNGSIPPSPPAPTEEGSSSHSSNAKTVSVTLNGKCDATTILIRDSSTSEPIKDAIAVLSTNDDLLSSTSNELGVASFNLCKNNIRLQVYASAYQAYDQKSLTIDCSCIVQPPKPTIQCKSDFECGEGNICSQKKCVQKPLECTKNNDCSTSNGKICSSNKCVQCALDSDCGINEFCSLNICKPKPIAVECSTNSDCLDVNNKVCSSNKCVQCIIDSDCSSGQSCSSNLCVMSKSSFEISAPSTLSTGKSSVIQFTKSDNVCANCDISITDPSGKTMASSTDTYGNYVFLPTLAGTYKISLIDSGTVAKTVSIQVASTQQPTSDNNSLILVIGLLLSVILVGSAVYLIFSRKD